MSFLDTLSDLAGSIGSFLGSNSVAANLAKTALLGLAINRLNSNVNRDSQRPGASENNRPDPGVRLQVDPNPETRIPIVYGTAYLGGIITDIQLTTANRDLYAVFTISEVTGVKLSDSQASEFSFGRILLNDQRVVFKANGVTVDYTVDRDGNVDRSLDGLCEIRCYRNGSSNNVAPQGYTLGSIVPATTYVPGWTANHTMTGLVFGVVKLTYDRERGVTRIPTVTWQVTNSMTKPGDVLLDYMTNTRYGAGIAAGEIASA